MPSESEYGIRPKSIPSGKENYEIGEALLCLYMDSGNQEIISGYEGLQQIKMNYWKNNLYLYGTALLLILALG